MFSRNGDSVCKRVRRALEISCSASLQVVWRRVFVSSPPTDEECILQNVWWVFQWFGMISVLLAVSRETLRQVSRRGVTSAPCKGSLSAGCRPSCKRAYSSISVDKNPVSSVANAVFCLRLRALLGFAVAWQDKVSRLPTLVRGGCGRAGAGAWAAALGSRLRLEAPLAPGSPRSSATQGERGLEDPLIF